MGWRQYTPSRTLNATEFKIAGLSVSDLIVILVSFSLAQPIFNFFHISLNYLLIITIINTLTLMFVRFKYRKRTIRDFILYLINQIEKGGIIYDSSINRRNRNR